MNLYPSVSKMNEEMQEFVEWLSFLYPELSRRLSASYEVQEHEQAEYQLLASLR